MIQKKHKYAFTKYCTGNDGVIFEQDTNEDHYMFLCQGMLQYFKKNPSIILIFFKTKYIKKLNQCAA